MLAAGSPQFSYLAVDLCFLLSGVVLSYAYDGRLERGLSASSFILIRLKRLAPLYLLGAAIGWMFVVFSLTQTKNHVGLVEASVLNSLSFPSLFAWQNEVFPLNGPFWSLFFELWVANLLFAALWKPLHGRLLWGLIAISFVGLLAAMAIRHTLDVGPHVTTFWFGFPRVAFSFFFGVAIARLHRSRPPRLKVPSIAFLAVLAVVLSLPFTGHAVHPVEILAVCLVFPALVYWGAEAIERSPRTGKLLGEVSYALYAIHYPIVIGVAILFAAWPMTHTVIFQLLLVVAVTLLAWLAARCDMVIRTKMDRLSLGRR